VRQAIRAVSARLCSCRNTRAASIRLSRSSSNSKPCRERPAQRTYDAVSEAGKAILDRYPRRNAPLISETPVMRRPKCRLRTHTSQWILIIYLRWIARLQRPPREGPKSEPKPPFHIKREYGSPSEVRLSSKPKGPWRRAAEIPSGPANSPHFSGSQLEDAVPRYHSRIAGIDSPLRYVIPISPWGISPDILC